MFEFNVWKQRRVRQDMVAVDKCAILLLLLGRRGLERTSNPNPGSDSSQSLDHGRFSPTKFRASCKIHSSSERILEKESMRRRHMHSVTDAPHAPSGKADTAQKTFGEALSSVGGASWLDSIRSVLHQK